MTEEFVNLRSRKNPKARIKLMGGHFATMNSHVNTYIDMSTVKTRHNNARETAATLAEVQNRYYGRNDRMSEKYRSDRRIYGRTSGGYRQDFHECRK